jgi:AcrR family transcriptional regulator
VGDIASATRTPRRQRRERGSITAEEILNGAFALAAEVTVEKLSMPRLAKLLNVGVMSMYWYFHSKEELLAAMRDRALEQYEIALPFTGDGEWHECLRTHFVEMRELFRTNPVLCDLLIMRTSDYGEHPNRVAYQRLEAIIATLIEAGFTAEHALDTYFSLAAHSRGFAMLERHANLDALAAAARRSAADPAASGDSAGYTVDSESMPILSTLAAAGYSLNLVHDRTFEAGLDALIERAKRLLRTDTPPR